MKTKALCLILLILIFAVAPRAVPHAFAADAQYARVVSGDAVLYRTDSGSDEIENMYFTLPKDYYVYLESAEVSGLYKVTYDLFTGYVKAADIDIVSYVPKLKYASGQTLKIELAESPYCYFREFPSVTSQTLGSGIPDQTEDITFFNYLAVGADNWYFIEYDGLTGYVRGDLVRVTKEIAPNDGEAETADDASRGGVSDTPQPLDTLTIVILTAVIGIPAIAILLLLFKPGRRRPAPARRGAGRVPRYFEDEE